MAAQSSYSPSPQKMWIGLSLVSPMAVRPQHTLKLVTGHGTRRLAAKGVAPSRLFFCFRRCIPPGGCGGRSGVASTIGSRPCSDAFSTVCSCLWTRSNAPKVSSFFWLLLHSSLVTAKRFERWLESQGAHLCEKCEGARNTTEHVLVHCWHAWSL